MSMYSSFLAGAVMMAYVVIGLFFLRYWRKTRDRFFGLFSLSFFLLALERNVIAANDVQIEELPKFYVIRLVAFLTIMIAIWDKNRSAPSS
jgi:predicted membrane-bound spermidine synthase